MTDTVSKDEVHSIIHRREDELKEFLSKEFSHRAKIDELTHNRIEEIMKEFVEKVKDNKETVKRAHTRLDEIDLKYVALATKIKTAQGIWGTITGLFGLALTYFGIKTGTN